jgi:uncharacterized protein (TIGR03083 family)
VTFDELRGVLNSSHERLAALLAPLTPEQAAAQSYDDDWSVGAVASHLGSGAQIFEIILDAGLQRTEPPGPDRFQPIWAQWNAKSPAEQVRDVVPSDKSFVDRLAALSPDQVEGWELTFFGATRNLTQLMQMRLSEHALHTWDIAVTFDPSATLPDDATAFLIDALNPVVGRGGKPTSSPLQVRVATSAPSRAFVLSLGPEQVTLTEGDSDEADLRLPAEAFVRLVYGRLDAEHTPSSVDSSVDLAVLRTAFPGF